MIEPPGFQDPDGRYTLSSGNAHNWREAGHLKDSCPKAATSAGVDCTPSTCDCSLGSSPHWYTNYTFIPPGVKPTIGPDSPMRTWFPEGTGFPDNIGGQPPNTPWRAPGTAPLYSPCGISGGNPTGCPPGNPDATNCGGKFSRAPFAPSFASKQRLHSRRLRARDGHACAAREHEANRLEAGLAAGGRLRVPREPRRRIPLLALPEAQDLRRLPRPDGGVLQQAPARVLRLHSVHRLHGPELGDVR